MNIDYNFYYWGPFLYKTTLPDETIQKILSFCKKKKSLNYRKNLAGHIKEEYRLNVKEIFPILAPYLNSYVQALYEQRGKIINKNIKMAGIWVNYMKQGEFNPPHTHHDDLSCALYLQIPNDMNKNKIGHIANSTPPGSINFTYGEDLKNNFFEHNFFPEKGDFFIFPAWLKHYVFPFRSNEERISVSANFKYINKKEKK
tara:strand:- start:44 stop:643 length:600 start_codon:yes stop_codon:yes gene_type:complete